MFAMSEDAGVEEVDRAHSDRDRGQQLLIGVAEHQHEGVLILDKKLFCALPQVAERAHEVQKVRDRVRIRFFIGLHEQQLRRL